MEKLELIFDTDVGADCDDMMALSYLVYAKRNLNLDIKAVTHSNSKEACTAAIRLFFENLGEEVPPIGRAVEGTKGYDNYGGAILERFGKGRTFPTEPDAVSVLRRSLVEAKNKAVICAVGPFANIAALLESKGDDISPLDGVSLMKEKCEKLVLMAGGFVNGEDGRPVPEWNVKVHIDASQKMVTLCPVPIVFVPFELGLGMITGKPAMDKFGEDTPLSLSFIKYGNTQKVGGRHSWDPATAVYAVEGLKDFFCEDLRGTVTVDDEGRTLMSQDPNGLHSVVTLRFAQGEDEKACKARVAAYIDACAMSAYGA